MDQRNLQQIIEELDQLLDNEREALLTGQLQKIHELMEAKNELIDQLRAAESLERSQLATVKSKFSRNQTLLESAMEGIRAVADRLADLRRVRQGLETYDQAGRKKVIVTTTNSNVEKRA